MTWGHNIIVDRWAGAYNPHSYPRPPRTHSHTHSHNGSLKNARFRNFRLDLYDGPADGPMDQWMVRQSLGLEMWKTVQSKALSPYPYLTINVSKIL